MNILFDENFPHPLRRFFLPEHQVTTVQKMQWLEAENGDLLAVAEAEFDVLLSTDKGIKYQQNFMGRDIAMIVLRTKDNRMGILIPLIPQVLALLPTVQPGQVYFVEPPAEPKAEQRFL